jgi:hypothetical protein
MRDFTSFSAGTGTTADLTVDADTTPEKSTYLDDPAPKAAFGLLLALRDSRLLNDLPKAYRLLIDSLILRSKYTDDSHTRAYCFPRYSTLAKDTGTCQKTLKLAAAALEDLDLITRTYRGFGTNIFVINVEKIWAAAQDAHKQEAEEAKAKEAETIQNAVEKKTAIKAAAAKRAATVKTSDQTTTVTPVTVSTIAPTPELSKNRWVGSDGEIVDACDIEDGGGYPDDCVGDPDGGAR